MRDNSKIAYASILVSSLVASGCTQSPIPTFREPGRLTTLVEDEKKIRDSELATDFTNIPSAPKRNEFIALRMYAIDLEYTKYESQLTHENAAIGLGSTIATLGLNGAAALIPAGQTARSLNGAALALTGATAAYDKDILLTQSIQNIQTQMRANRSDQAAKIISSISCDLSSYPVGLALSDLELYYRAGTLTAGLIGVTNTVNQAAMDAKAKKDSASPAQAVKAPADQHIQNIANVAEAQATAPISKACIPIQRK